MQACLLIVSSPSPAPRLAVPGTVDALRTGRTPGTIVAAAAAEPQTRGKHERFNQPSNSAAHVCPVESSNG
jgi:hypothetical protein